LPHRVELHPKSEDLESLVKLASEIQPVLVIFDTLARCFKGNENETADMNQHIAAIDAIREEAGAATLSLHHTPKKNLTIMRGAESLRDRADVILKVVRTGKKGPVELSIEKEREEATGETYRVNRTYVPLVNSYAVEFVAKAREENDEAATLTANQQKALEALGKSPKTSSDWKRAAGLKKQSFYDAKSGLLESGHVVKNGRFYAVQLPQSPESERVRTRVH
jgi:RecA-family ATPase